MSALSYDLHQFAAVDHRIVTAESRIAFSDRVRMHCLRRRGSYKHSSAPEWAMNDKLLQQVIVENLEARYYINPDPNASYSERLGTIRKVAAVRLLRVAEAFENILQRGDAQDIHQADKLFTVERRGVPELWAAVVYHYWRLDWTSAQVAEELGLTPCHVREIIYRLGRTWNRLQSGWRPKIARATAICTVARDLPIASAASGRA